MIDAHLHFWDPDTFSDDWLQYVLPTSRCMGPDEFAKTGVRLKDAIVVQADCGPAQSLDEVDGFMSAAGFLAGMIAAAKAGLSVDMCILARQLPDLRQVLSHFFAAAPDARIILNHLGKPDIKSHGADTDGDDWANEINLLSQFTNVVCTLSGLPTEAYWENWTPEQVCPNLDDALNSFGPDRCLFGNEAPVV